MQIDGLRQRAWRLILKLGRFGLVGGIATVNYACAVPIFIELLGFTPLLGAISGFLVSVPISYFGHRGWSFRSSGRHSEEFSRFAVTSITGFTAVTGSSVLTVDLLQLHYMWGVLLASFVVPVGTFITLNLFVFREQADRGPAADAAPGLTDDTAKAEKRSG